MMSQSPRTEKKNSKSIAPTLLFGFLVIICIVVIFVGFCGKLGENRWPLFTLLVAVLIAFLGWATLKNYHWGICILLCICLVVCLIWAVQEKPQEPSSVPPSSSAPPAEDSSMIPEPLEPPATAPKPVDADDEVSIGTGLSNATVEEIEKDSKQKNNYFPALDMENMGHIFFTIELEAAIQEDTIVTDEVWSNSSYILERVDKFTDAALKDDVCQKYQNTMHSVEIEEPQNKQDRILVSNQIERTQELNAELKQAYANNEPKLMLYSELAQCYEKVVEKEKRGSFYLQLGRPYEESIKFINRDTNEGKNKVFITGAKAVSAFRTALIYKDRIKESLPDLLFRIAKIYHYLGDTPGLDIKCRTYLYRIAIAYSEAAADLELTEENVTYLGYISYYKAMVYHKLGVISSDSATKSDYFKSAKKSYELADDQRKLRNFDFKESEKQEIQHAIKDVENRLKRMENTKELE